MQWRTGPTPSIFNLDLTPSMESYPQRLRPRTVISRKSSNQTPEASDGATDKTFETVHTPNCFRFKPLTMPVQSDNLNLESDPRGFASADSFRKLDAPAFGRQKTT